MVGDLPGQIFAIGCQPGAYELIHDGDLDFGRSAQGAGPGLFKILGRGERIAHAEVDAAQRFQ